ncbi:MAG TPA: SH3 domain-containing protein [Rectinemataceae bacterium]
MQRLARKPRLLASGCAPCAGALVLLLALLVSSCAPRRIGWGVMLWTVKGTSAKSGSVVPIYLKSAITKVYVIGLEAERDQRVEVPIWQLEEYRTKAAAERRARAFAPIASLYLVAGRDGLPIRKEPNNAAARTYRLREGELVKILDEVEGEALYTGEKRLPGTWYQVMAADGSRGYCFSYTMRLYDESSGAEPIVPEAERESDGLDILLSKTWRPSWYSRMLEEDSVDPDYFALRFGLFPDPVNKQIRVELPARSAYFDYDRVGFVSGWLEFEGSPLRIKVEGSTSILVYWGKEDPALLPGQPDEGAAHLAQTEYFRFVSPQEDLREALRAEESRRSAAMRSFFSKAAELYGTSSDSTLVFVSPQGGRLELWPSGLYAWSGTHFLPAGFSPEEKVEGGSEGRVSFGLRIAPGQKLLWQGGFSLYSSVGKGRADFLYRMDSSGLSLARALPFAPGEAANGVDNRLGTAVFAFSK